MGRCYKVSRARGKNSEFRTEGEGSECRSQLRFSSAERSDPVGGEPSPSKPSPATLENKRRERVCLQPDSRVADLLDAWGDNVEPFCMIDDREKVASVLLAAYPRTDLVAESRKIIAWWMANPSKRKTRRGVKRFLNAWFARAAEPRRAYTVSGDARSHAPYSAADLWGDDE